MSNALKLFCMILEFIEGMVKFSEDHHETTCYHVECKWLLLNLTFLILKMVSKDALPSTWSDTKYYTDFFMREK